MTQKPFLLITNDDGIHAPGIKHLWRSVKEYAEVVIVAPQFEKSGAGVSITHTQPLHIRPVAWEDPTPAWSLNGTPADCVKMALSVLLPRQPDFIISGVNQGSNSGRTVLHSGTVGAVIEGVLKGIPGIAFSFSDEEVPPLETTRNYIYPLIHHFLNHSLPMGTFLNVNFPYQCQTSLKGFRMAKQGKGHWMEAPDRRIHPEGIPYYWLGGVWARPAEEDPDSDVALLEQGYVTAVPIHIDQLTDHEAFHQHKEKVEKSLEKQLINLQS